VVQAIRKGIAKAVSDGSYLKGSGAAGFILIGSKRKRQLKGSLVLPGSCATMSAYRSELGGLYGIVCLTEQLCLEHKVTKGKITIGCDGQEHREKSPASYFKYCSLHHTVMGFDEQQTIIDIDCYYLSLAGN
jgi:hypothetical protein